MLRYVALGMVALSLTALSLGGCARRGEAPPALLGGSGGAEDDDTFCRANGGPAGSNEYVACRRNRDAQRGNAADRADKAQRKLGDYMLNNNPANPARQF